MTQATPSTTTDLWGGLGWVALGSAIVEESLRMERFTKMGATIYMMPGFTPAMIGGVLIVLGAVLAWRGWRARQRVAPVALSPSSIPGSAPIAASNDGLLNRRMLATLALTLVYAGVLIGRMPFMLATAVFVAAFTWVFAEPDMPAFKRVWTAVLAGAFTALIVVVVFERIFLVRLP